MERQTTLAGRPIKSVMLINFFGCRLFFASHRRDSSGHGTDPLGAGGMGGGGGGSVKGTGRVLEVIANTFTPAESEFLQSA